ncbi:membrane-spanning 4-domains subfamily A member 4A-like [Salminus brasiliensis]|uniref:membrane-spanning 4-domains subfamily A member 4A-like n=1 Tax=Salminus brasiliensis TaxID=930266 RepID=UPI003B834C3A
MSGTAIPLSNMGNGYTIVTHVIPPATGNSTATVQNVSSGGSLQKFLKGEPKALGTVQIMTGLLMVLIGIVISILAHPPIVVYSGISFWGGLLYITAGSLSVSASNKLNRCVVKGSLTMNIISTMAAAIAIIMFSIDLAIMSPMCYYSDYNYYSQSSCTSRNTAKGTVGVLLVFSILQFFISICISAFSCKAVCNSEPVVNITVVPNQEANCSVVNPFPAQNTQQWMYGVSGAAMSAPPMESPPEYTETKCFPDN